MKKAIALQVAANAILVALNKILQSRGVKQIKNHFSNSNASAVQAEFDLAVGELFGIEQNTNNAQSRGLEIITQSNPNAVLDMLVSSGFGSNAKKIGNKKKEVAVEISNTNEATSIFKKMPLSQIKKASKNKLMLACLEIGKEFNSNDKAQMAQIIHDFLNKKEGDN